MSFSVEVSHGSNKHSLSITNPATTSIGELKSRLHEVTGVPTEGQKLIFRGRTLKDDSQLVSDTQLKKGSKLIMLGRTIDPCQEDHLKSFDVIVATVDRVEQKFVRLDEELDGIEKGFLDRSLVHEACNRLDKQVIGCSEQFMQALEQIDGIILGASETLVRGKRKVLVNRVQNLLDLSDKLRTRLQQCQKKQK